MTDRACGGYWNGCRCLDCLARQADENHRVEALLYDEKYDMAASSLGAPIDAKAAISMSSNDMREAGLEPAHLSAPDPKSHRGAESADSRPISIGSGATERHAPTANAAESTTDCTTSGEEGASADDPPSSRRSVRLARFQREYSPL